jgi:transcription elongation factor GreA
MAKEFKITSLRRDDLLNELNYLKTTREREVAAMIAEARSYGDLSENSEYDAAKDEQGRLYARIAEIEDILNHAVIIEDENEATGRVGLGCTVTVAFHKRHKNAVNRFARVFFTYVCKLVQEYII